MARADAPSGAGALKQSRHTNRSPDARVTPEEARLLADSWRHLTSRGEGELSAHDVALVDELQLLLGEAAVRRSVRWTRSTC
ncbi:hypothetical protein GCM10020229_24760 [Kitasatospora albolonga]